MKRLMRSETNKKLLGVCGGIAEYLGVDPTLVRVGFVVFAALAGSGLLIYLLIALLMPKAADAE